MDSYYLIREIYFYSIELRLIALSRGLLACLNHNIHFNHCLLHENILVINFFDVFVERLVLLLEDLILG